MSQTQSENFPLNWPFTTAAGEKISQLTLKRLTVKNLKQVKKKYKDPADWDEPLISLSTGLPPEDLDNMDLADYLELQTRFQKITGLGKKPGDDDKGTGTAGEVVPVPAGGN